MLIALVPVFNEEKNIINFLSRLESQVGYIIIVNDGSQDKTSDLLSGWLKNKQKVIYIYSLKNTGMSKALLQGFRLIEKEFKQGRFDPGDAVITIDADGQHDPGLIRELYEYFSNNQLDILITRRDFSHYPFYRTAGNRLMSKANSLIANFRFNDTESGLKIMKIGFIPELLKYYTGLRYSCSGEIGVIASLLKYKIDNNYSIQAPYSRKRKGGPGLGDVFINLSFSLLAALKIKKDKKKTSSRPV